MAIGDISYSTPVWNYHQVTMLSGNVFDACASQSVDLSGTVYGLPPFNWALSDFWQTNTGRGLVATPSPSTWDYHDVIATGLFNPTVD